MCDVRWCACTSGRSGPGWGASDRPYETTDHLGPADVGGGPDQILRRHASCRCWGLCIGSRHAGCGWVFKLLVRWLDWRSTNSGPTTSTGRPVVRRFTYQAPPVKPVQWTGFASWQRPLSLRAAVALASCFARCCARGGCADRIFRPLAATGMLLYSSSRSAITASIKITGSSGPFGCKLTLFTSCGIVLAVAVVIQCRDRTQSLAFCSSGFWHADFRGLFQLDHQRPICAAAGPAAAIVAFRSVGNDQKIGLVRVAGSGRRSSRPRPRWRCSAVGPTCRWRSPRANAVDAAT